MTTLTFNYGFWEFWADYDPANGYFGDQNVVFDGDNKLIYISKSVFEISVRDDIYSNWKEWILVRDNGKYPAAIRTTGGDPINAVESLGDVYFLINGWRIVIDHNCQINGVIYSDDFPSPFVQDANTQLVTNKVSALVQTYQPDLSSLTLPTSLENAAAVWQYITRTLTASPGPTTTQIRQEIDANSTRLSSIETKIDTFDNAESIWNYTTRTLTSPSGPTSEEIRQEIDANSTRLSSIETKIDTLDNAEAIRQEIDANSTRLASIETKIDTFDNAESIWNYTTRTLTSPSGPTSTEIRQEIDANSTRLSSIESKVDALPTAQDISQEVWNYTLRELTTTMTPEQFWNFLLTAPLVPGSAGAKLKETLTNNNFLALK